MARMILAYGMFVALVMGCNESIEDPTTCDEFVGSATVSGIVRDFDGVVLPNAVVEIAVADVNECESRFGRIVARGLTDDEGKFVVTLRPVNTEGEHCVFGRVAGSESVSKGRVDFVSECAEKEPSEVLRLDLVATVSAIIPRDLQIALYRLHSHNNGPHYQVSVDAVGRVLFDGIDNALVEGVTIGKVEQETVARLYRAFEDVRYWDIKTFYPRSECSHYGFDVHYAGTSLRAHGREHRVSNDHGCCGVPELELLAELECTIDSVLETQKWTGSEAAPCRWRPGAVCPPSG